MGRAPARTATPSDACFGKTCVRTRWSLDAWLLGKRFTGPADAHRYFKGETIKQPAGCDSEITTPLGWAGVTDHSEYVGVIEYTNDPNAPVSKLPAAQVSKIDPNKPLLEQGNRIYAYAAKALFGGPPVKALRGPPQRLWSAWHSCSFGSCDASHTKILADDFLLRGSLQSMRGIIANACRRVCGGVSRPVGAAVRQTPGNSRCGVQERLRFALARTGGSDIQSSSFSPGTRSKWRVLWVTSVRPSASAWAAICVSISPMGLPVRRFASFSAP